MTEKNGTEPSISVEKIGSRGWRTIFDIDDGENRAPAVLRTGFDTSIYDINIVTNDSFGFYEK